MSCQILRALPAFVAAVAMASPSLADTLAEWNFNATSSPANASTGVGTTSGGFFPFSSALPEQTGSPADMNPVDVGGMPNNSSAGRSGPNPGEASGTRNFSAFTSTEGFYAPSITWDLLAGFRTSRYYQILSTTDGTNFAPVPTGTGSSVSGAFGTVDISADGLIDLRTIDGLIDDNMGTGYQNDLSFTFPAGTAHDDNPNFGVRVTAIHDPSGSDYVSSFAGTTDADTEKGFIRSTSAGGNQIRYDLIRITAPAIPEPTSLLLAACGLGLAGVQRRR